MQQIAAAPCRSFISGLSPVTRSLPWKNGSLQTGIASIASATGGINERSVYTAGPHLQALQAGTSAANLYAANRFSALQTTNPNDKSIFYAGIGHNVAARLEVGRGSAITTIDSFLANRPNGEAIAVMLAVNAQQLGLNVFRGQQNVADSTVYFLAAINRLSPQDTFIDPTQI